MPLLMLLLGCPPSRETFVREDADLFCTYVSECEVETRVDSCDGPSKVYSYEECSAAVTENGNRWYAGCAYNPESAAECLRAYRQDRDPGECPAEGFGSSACSDVFDCMDWPYLWCDD